MEQTDLSLEQLLKNYYETTNEKTVSVNRQGKTIAMNDAAKDTLTGGDNYNAMTNAIRHRCEGYSNEYDVQSYKDCFLETTRLQHSNFQVFMKTKDSGIKPFTTMYQNTDEQRGISTFTLQDAMPQIERQKKMYQQKVLYRPVQAQENERKRISKELHDSVMQGILNIGVGLRLLKYKRRDKVLVETSQRIEGLLSQLIDDIRNMSAELRLSSLDDLGIEAAFKSYFRQFGENYGMHIKYDSDTKGICFGNEIETVVYHVVQEGVFNALKYAEVNEIEVSTHSDGKQLIAKVVDRGKGFSLDHYPKGSGLGLYGMRERVELVNGHANVETHIDRGIIITLDISI